MVSEYKCTALKVEMEATMGERCTVDPLVSASPVCVGAPEQDAWAAAAQQAQPSAAQGRGTDDDDPEGLQNMGEEGDAHSVRSEGCSSPGAASDCVMAYFGDHQVSGRFSLV